LHGSKLPAIVAAFRFLPGAFASGEQRVVEPLRLGFATYMTDGEVTGEVL
jgi:hypothetical protein